MTPILQTEAAECALACLAMVAAHHGQHLSLGELRARFPQGGKGANLKQLVGQAAALGLSGRPLRLELDDLGKLARPCVLHWDMNHFVVLVKVHGRSAITVLDPAVGRRRLAWAEVSRHFTGVALELAPNAEFQPQEAPPRVRLSQLTGRVRGLVGSLLAIGAVALALEVFALAAPLLNQLVVDDAIVTHDRELLGVLVLGFALMLLIQVGLGLARSWMVIVLGQSLSLQWLGNVFAHLLRLPTAYFEQRHLGDVVSRFGAVREIQRTLTTSSVEAVLDGLMAVAAGLMMLWYSPRLAAVVALALGGYGLLRWAAWRPLREAAAERLVISARESTHFLETLRAIQPLKLFGREESRRARWQNLIVEVQNRDVRTARLQMVFSTSQTLLFGAENLAVLYMGATMVMEVSHGGEAFSVGMLFAFLSYKGQFTGRVAALIDFVAEFKMLGLQAERLADIVLTAPEAATPVPDHDLAHLSPTLELRDVSFRYGVGEPWVLHQVSLRIDAGQRVAIAGPSGAGKTTLLKVMLGLLAPTEGQVLYGGVPIGQLGLANVRRRVGTVMQDDVLLTGSLADNISFFDTEPVQERVVQCAQWARLHEDIVRMPMGYQTLAGDLGSGLSGGQKQRLMLARALYKQPSVLALDEATSHLDLATEREIVRTLAGLPITQLVIAHRPDTLAAASRVIVLSDARLSESTLEQALPGPAASGPDDALA